jgi:RNA polymerase sigma-70 factor, ECF subfamily
MRIVTIDRVSDEQQKRFTRLAWPYLQTVLRTARFVASSEADAEDLAQDTMLKAMRAIDRFQDGTDMKAWLITILKRTFIDKLRAEQRRIKPQGLEDIDPAAEENALAGVSDDEWHEPEKLLNQFEDEAVIEALRKLPQDIRWTLLLLDVEQMDQASAAGVLDVPVGTIKSRAHYGRKMLRDLLYQMAQKRGWVVQVRSPSP